jgi:hypothetical protein
MFGDTAYRSLLDPGNRSCGGPPQELRADERVDYLAACRRIEPPEADRLRERHTKAGHLDELTAHAFYQTVDFSRGHHITSFQQGAQRTGRVLVGVTARVTPRGRGIRAAAFPDVSGVCAPVVCRDSDVFVGIESGRDNCVALAI